MSGEHVRITGFNSNPNVGLYAFANDEFCILGREISEQEREETEKILGVPVHSLNIAGTPLVGVFVCGNSNCILIPSIALSDEKKTLEQKGVTFEEINTINTALGNNVLCTDKGAILNPDLEEDVAYQIKESLEVPIKKMTIAGINSVGAVARIINGRCLVHRDASPEEIDEIEKFLGVTCVKGTMNMGSPFVSSAIFGNSNGFIAGNLSGGPEITNADEAFGFLEKK